MLKYLSSKRMRTAKAMYFTLVKVYNIWAKYEWDKDRKVEIPIWKGKLNFIELGRKARKYRRWSNKIPS